MVSIYVLDPEWLFKVGDGGFRTLLRRFKEIRDSFKYLWSNLDKNIYKENPIS